MKHTNSQRGMKKWQPFNALEHYDEYISYTYIEKNKTEKPILSEEQLSDINDKLFYYNHDNVEITYFAQGHILKTKGIINKIDIRNQLLMINKIKILFTNLIKLDYDI